MGCAASTQGHAGSSSAPQARPSALPPVNSKPLVQWTEKDVEKWATSLDPQMTRNALLLLPADGKRVLSWTEKDLEAAGVANPVYRRQLLSLRDGLAEQQQQQQLQQLQQQEARQGSSTPAGGSSAPTSTAKALNTLSAKLGKALGAGAKPGGETWFKAAGGKLLALYGKSHSVAQAGLAQLADVLPLPGACTCAALSALLGTEGSALVNKERTRELIERSLEVMDLVVEGQGYLFTRQADFVRVMCRFQDLLQEVGAYSQDCSGRDALLTLLPPVNLEGATESLHLSMVAGLSDPTAPDSTIFVKGISGKLATPKASSDGAAALKGISGKLLSPKGVAGKALPLATAGVGSVKDHFQELQASLQELRSDAALGGGVKPYGRSSQSGGADEHESSPLIRSLAEGITLLVSDKAKVRAAMEAAGGESALLTSVSKRRELLCKLCVEDRLKWAAVDSLAAELDHGVHRNIQHPDLRVLWHVFFPGLDKVGWQQWWEQFPAGLREAAPHIPEVEVAAMEAALASDAARNAFQVAVNRYYTSHVSVDEVHLAFPQNSRTLLLAVQQLRAPGSPPVPGTETASNCKQQLAATARNSDRNSAQGKADGERATPAVAEATPATPATPGATAGAAADGAPGAEGAPDTRPPSRAASPRPSSTQAATDTAGAAAGVAAPVDRAAAAAQPAATPSPSLDSDPSNPNSARGSPAGHLPVDPVPEGPTPATVDRSPEEASTAATAEEASPAAVIEDAAATPAPKDCTPSSTSLGWGLPPQDALYVPRDGGYSEDLASRLQPRGGACRCLCLVGAAGLGRSSLALELAWRLHGQGLLPGGAKLVELREARNAMDVCARFRAAVDVEQCPEGDQAAFLSRLLSIEGACLLIVTNADDTLNSSQPSALPALLSKVLSIAPQLLVLVTSRLPLPEGSIAFEHELGGTHPRVINTDLPPLTPETAGALVRSAVAPLTLGEEQAAEVAAVANGSPLLLRLLSRGLAAGRVTPAQLREVAIERTTAIVALAVATLPDARHREALAQLSVFPCGWDLPAAAAVLGCNAARARALLSALQRGGLVLTDPVAGRYRLHPAVQAAASGKVSLIKRPSRALSKGLSFHGMGVGAEGDAADAIRERYVRHTLRRLSGLARAFCSAAYELALRSARRYEADVASLLQFLASSELTPGLAVAAADAVAAAGMSSTADFFDAIGLLTSPRSAAAWANALRVLQMAGSGGAGGGGGSGALHKPPAAAALQAQLVLSWHTQAQGQYPQALGQAKWAAEGLSQVLGPSHPSTLAAISAHAGCLYAVGSAAESEAMHLGVLEAREAMHGPDAVETLAAVTNLGISLQALGRDDEALPLFRRAAEGAERALGGRHPAALAAAANLANCLCGLKQYDEALPLYRRMADQAEGQAPSADPSVVATASMPPTHPSALACVANLAACLVEAGAEAEALPLCRRVLEGREHVLGPRHPDALQATSALAACMLALGQSAKALPLFQRVWEETERALGDEHPDTLVALANLAACMRQLGRLDDAAPLYERAAQAAELALGAQHPVTQAAARGLRGCLEGSRASPGPPGGSLLPPCSAGGAGSRVGSAAGMGVGGTAMRMLGAGSGVGSGLMSLARAIAGGNGGGGGGEGVWTVDEWDEAAEGGWFAPVGMV